MKKLAEMLVRNFGARYTELMDIKVETGDDEEIFKWFLASVLFGAPIRAETAIKTYKCFKMRGVLSPSKILETGWDGLVEILDEGGYTRYDFKTATKLLEIAKNLQERYGGSLNSLHEKASDSRDLEERIKNLAKGIGDATVSIFLRELREIWAKADPKPTSLVILSAKNLGIIRSDNPDAALRELKTFWEKNAVKGYGFANFETALLRVGKDYCRKGRCEACPFRVYCIKSSRDA